MPQNVLYVDDERDNLTVFAARFRKIFTVFTAESGAEGLEIIDRNEIQVVISDQRMPNMSGIELLEQVRARHPDTMRVVLTAYSDPGDIIDAINKGAVHSFVMKPWHAEHLQSIIEKSLEHYNMRLRSRQSMANLYKSIGNLAGMKQRIPAQVREQIENQFDILNQAMDGSASQDTYLARWKDSLNRINEVLDSTEAEYADQWILSSDSNDTPAIDSPGLLDEDLLYAMQQFPEKRTTVHRLHFTNNEFRQLCTDYYECNKMITNASASQHGNVEEYVHLKKQLESELQTYFN